MLCIQKPSENLRHIFTPLRPIGRAASDADTDRVVPVRSVAFGPTGGDS